MTLSRQLRRFTAIVFMTISMAAMAYKATGIVANQNNQPLADATIRLLEASDSVFLKGTIADTAGWFTLTNLKKGNYIVETSYIGHETSHLPFTITDKDVRLDTIKVAESTVLLNEATVVGAAPPIKVMQDTIEYNVDSYQTEPNAVVEELLKRLPGVEVDADGKITANGKEVKKMMVDGKEFFFDDPKVASKNLPVDMVDKLQVIDRKSDFTRLTGVDDGEEETVINLKVKKGRKNGWFGKAGAGYGTDRRYAANVNANRFWNDNQFTLIGSANNTNGLGFTDVGDSHFQRGGNSRGINKSSQAGANFNVGRGDTLRVGGDVMYSNSNRTTTTSRDRKYLLKIPRTETSGSDARDRGHNLRADFRVEWKPDSFHTLDFRPSFSYNTNRTISSSRDKMFQTPTNDEDPAATLGRLMNNSRNNTWRHGHAIGASGRIIYSHRFKSHRGRSFSISANYSMNDTREWGNSNAYTYFGNNADADDAHNNSDTEGESINKAAIARAGEDYRDYVYEQYNTNRSWSNSVNARATWTEPLGNVSGGHFLNISYNISYRWNNADKIATQRSPLENPWEGANPENPDMSRWEYGPWEFQPDISNRFRNSFMNQDMRLGYNKVSATYTLNAGLSVTPSMSESNDLINPKKNIPERWVWNYAPFVRYRHRFDKRTSLSVNYNGRSSQPSLRQLQPVEDNSNPMRIVKGNPNLNPSFEHSVGARFQKFYPETQRSVNINLDASATQNAIVSLTRFDNNGRRFTTYENVNGTWSARFSNMISVPFGSSKQWSFSNNISVNVSHRIGYNNGDRNNSTSTNVSESPSLSFRPQSIELALRPHWRMQTTSNSLQGQNNTTIHNYGGTFTGSWYAPFGLVLATDLTYRTSTGYSQGYNQREWMWNASIAYQFLRNRTATIMLRGYDLLRQQSDVSRSVTANYIDDSRYLTLTRYFMLSFTYTINSFGRGGRHRGNGENARSNQGQGFGGGGGRHLHR